MSGEFSTMSMLQYNYSILLYLLPPFDSNIKSLRVILLKKAVGGWGSITTIKKNIKKQA